MSAVVNHHAVAEFAARQNAETMAAQQREHRVELDRLHHQLRKLQADNDDLKRHTRMALDYIDGLQHAVVTINGQRMTLWDAYEREVYTPLCWCESRECPGDHRNPSDPGDPEDFGVIR
jgi:hypothetical protein